MAGSYQHCRAEDGSFRFGLIDNLGDAHEACEMMYYMIQWLASSLPLSENAIRDAENSYYAWKRGKIHNAFWDESE